MTDLYLQELMNGNIKNNVSESKISSKLDLEIEKDIEKTINSQELELSENPLESPLMRKQKMKLEMKKELELAEFSPLMKNAVQLLLKSSELNPSESEAILNDLSKIRSILDDFNVNEALQKDPKEVFDFSSESMESILKLGLKKMENNELDSSLALFFFLAMLDPKNLEYFYRAGLVAQMAGYYDQAIKFYSICYTNNPDIVEAKILTMDCFAKLGNKDKVTQLYDEISLRLEDVQGEIFKNIILESKNIK